MRRRSPIVSRAGRGKRENYGMRDDGEVSLRFCFAHSNVRTLCARVPGERTIVGAGLSLKKKSLIYPRSPKYSLPAVGALARKTTSERRHGETVAGN